MVVYRIMRCLQEERFLLGYVMYNLTNKNLFQISHKAHGI